jgi:hypothetical protein
MPKCLLYLLAVFAEIEWESHTGAFYVPGANGNGQGSNLSACLENPGVEQRRWCKYDESH